MNKADNFILSDNEGNKFELYEQLKKTPVVLFFYPAAFTPGCTKQACHFRDLKSEFNKYGVEIYGISSDSVEKNNEFTKKHNFPFPLLSDPKKEVISSFGINKKGLLKKFIPLKRSTFVIDQDASIIAKVSGEFDSNKHADEALIALKEHTKN